MVRNQQRTSVSGLIKILEEDVGSGTGHAYYRYVPAEATSEWLIVHTFERVPLVTVFDEFGREMDADVYSTTSAVTITHGEPMYGSAVLIA